MPQVPAVVAGHREVAQQALESGDQHAANLAYSLELQALAADAHSADEDLSPRQALVIPAATEERVEGVLGALEDLEGPEAVTALQRLWPGQEMAKNLGAVAWTVARYSLTDYDSDPQLLANAVSLAKQTFAEVHPELKDGPVPVPVAIAEEFLAEYDAADREVMRRSHGVELTTNLGFLGWMLRRYAPGIEPNSEVEILQITAGVGRGVSADLKAAKPRAKPRDPAVNDEETKPVSTEIEVENKLEDLRAQIAKAQGEGNSMKANRLFREEQAIIADHEGDAPVIGSGQRYS